MWDLQGSSSQNSLVREAIDACDFDFTKCLPSLAEEGKTSVRVDWTDLSRYAASKGEEHNHIHNGNAIAHPIERFVDGRARVLGLFYLPPYTRIVLDTGLWDTPVLAKEVFLAEGAHCVDYHYMTPEHRRLFTNAVHRDQLDPESDTSDGTPFVLDGHICSWFEVGTYAWWVGEAFMEGFIEGTSNVACTIQLAHPVGPEDRAVIRSFLGIDDVESASPVFATRGGRVVHDKHGGIKPARWWDSLSLAEEDGMRACKTCKP